MSDLAPCVFCRIVERRLPASLVHEDDLALCFLDLEPMNPGHTLVAPRRHVPSLDDLDDATGSHLFLLAARVQRALRAAAGIRCEGVNVFLADGESAGQEVPHLHLHVLPRFSGDGVTIAHDRSAPPPRDELDAIAGEIATAFAAGA